MPVKTRAIFIKQSGEKLHGPSLSSVNWSSGAVKEISKKLAQIYQAREELGILGLTIVSGAGNIARGNELKNEKIALHYGDVIGRAATILNTVVIADALEQLNIPSEIFVAKKMRYADPSIKTTVYSPQNLAAAHRQAKIALIAGGTGDDNVTTDNAVVLYAADYASHTNKEVVVLKSTKVDGVYDADPAQNSNARRYQIISAGYMLSNYGDFKVVDKTSLKSLISNNLSMLVYSEDDHSLVELLKANGGPAVGTKILPEAVIPTFY